MYNNHSLRRPAYLAVKVFGIAALVAVGIFYFGGNSLALKQDIFYFPEDLEILNTETVRTTIASVIGSYNPAKPARDEIIIDYPFDKSIFPPDIAPPTLQWHYASTACNAWVLEVEFKATKHRVYALTKGQRKEKPIDPESVSDTNEYKEDEYEKSAREWTVEENIWEILKKYSLQTDAVVHIYAIQYSENPAKLEAILARGKVSLLTSKDKVAAPIFYRDVPLMPSETEDGVVKPLAQNALPLIKWRLRDISRPESKIIMQGLPTCANCHSFSADGKRIGMDMDGPQGDKGAYALLEIKKDIVIERENIFSWNSYNKKQVAFGLFSKVSPNGKHVISAVDEAVHVQNYMDYKFLQTFYPTRSILAWYSEDTKKIMPLPGADDRRYVQCNPEWSPDGKYIVFLRAKAMDPYRKDTARATYALDPHETQIKYSLYRIPFNNGLGGAAEPVPGGSDPEKSLSFPRFSPDGRWLVFVKSANGLLMRPDSKLYLMPAQGGTPRLMSCNTPSMNSWHSFSPNSKWLVFSSKYKTPFTRMFLTHVDENGNDSPAILIPASTQANRAVNLPEFANIKYEDFNHINTPALDYKRHLDQGKALAIAGDMTKAYDELVKALDLRTDYSDIYSTLGYILEEQGKADEAMEYYTSAIAHDGDNEFNHINLGVLFNSKGLYDQAISHFKHAADINDKNVTAHYNWGISLQRKNLPSEARVQFNKVLELDRDFYNARVQIGNCFFNQNRYDKAVAEYKKALEINRTNDLIYYRLANAYNGLKDTRNAIANYTKAIELNPRNAYAYHNRGNAYIRTSAIEDGIKDLSKSISLNSEMPVFYKNRAYAYMIRGDMNRAVEDINQAISLNSDYGEAHFMLGNIAMRTGDYDAAIKSYSKAMSAKLIHLEAAYNLATLYGMNNQFDKAVVLMSAMIEKNPEDINAHITRGSAYYSQGAIDKAISDFLRAEKIDESIPQVYYNLGLCYEQRNDTDNAIKSFQKFADLSPKDSGALAQAKNKIRQLKSKP
jgi:tetratricopeptide (TPR) repeat protein